MTMPIDFVLVRHGESEGNVVKKAAKRGDTSHVPEEFFERPGAAFRLTDRGIAQAQATGAWLRTEFSTGHPAEAALFDRHVCSEHLRAMETAAHLGLPAARWHRDTRLQERYWGDLDPIPTAEALADKKIVEHLSWMKRDPFNVAPPNGESIRQLCERLWQAMQGLHRTPYSRVIWVCHGEVIRAARFLLERMTQPEYSAMCASQESADRVRNGQVVHYTRCNPETGQLIDRLGWVRSIVPDGATVTTYGWRNIHRRTFSNEELLAEIEHTARLLNDPSP